MSLPPSSELKEISMTKPARYLIAKGLPTLPMRTAEKAWNMEYIDMEEFLPASRSLCLAEQTRPAVSLQQSLVGALNQFQATQQQKGPRVMNIVTWVRCFSLYIAVMARKAVEMMACMVLHLHKPACYLIAKGLPTLPMRTAHENNSWLILFPHQTRAMWQGVGTSPS